MKKLLIASVVSVLFVGALVANEMINAPTAEASGGGTRGPAGPSGAAGATGPTGPAWTTCAEADASLGVSETTGTCGAVVLSSSPTLTTPNIGVATGTSLTIASGSISSTSAGSTPAITAVNASSSGNALRLTGDTTTPTVAPIFIDPLDANPSTSGAAGNFFVFTGGILRGRTGSSIYTAVANYGTLATAAAAGTNQATATALTAGSDFYTITACDAAKGITLTQGGAGTCLRVMAQSSTVTNTCNIYGHASDNDTINGSAADGVYVQPAGTSLVYCTADGTAWFTY